AFDAPRRALVVAGQHGDEPIAMNAVEAIAARHPPTEGQAVAFIHCANPDGRRARTRCTSAGVDLNRDHQRLQAPETQALHRFARAFSPQMVIDAHTFKPRRRFLLAHGLEWGADVMVELDNHPGALDDYAERWKTWICPVMAQLAPEDVRLDRYLVASATGGLRVSSCDLVDGRNGLAASVGAVGILIEGREPSRRYGSAMRTRRTMMRAIEVLLDRWMTTESVSAVEASTLHLDVRRRGAEISAFTLGQNDDEPRRRRLPGRPLVDVTAARPVAVPSAYGVPRQAHQLVALLARHGFAPVEPSAVAQTIAVEQTAVIRDGRPSKRTGLLRRPDLEWRNQRPRLDAHLYFSTEQPRGHRLVAML
ncbi:MAG: hypothetical protein AAFV29_25655, partial [Myxococcota bacterium]